MAKIVNYNVVLKLFVLLLTFKVILSCAEKKYTIQKIEGKQIQITEDFLNTSDRRVIENNNKIENTTKPYREKIDFDLNLILSDAPETIDKIGEWQTPMGNFLADLTFEKASKLFQLKEGKTLDICLLNTGGIRSVISKGAVTARNAFEIMPFENSCVVIGFKASHIIEIINFIIEDKKPHPLSGLSFTIDKNNKAQNILVNGSSLQYDKLYYVVTSDYLSNGGDNMVFFKNAIEKYDLEYKLRNLIIDYFKETKVITFNKDVRITKE